MWCKISYWNWSYGLTYWPVYLEFWKVWLSHTSCDAWEFHCCWGTCKWGFPWKRLRSVLILVALQRKNASDPAGRLPFFPKYVGYAHFLGFLILLYIRLAETCYAHLKKSLVGMYPLEPRWALLEAHQDSRVALGAAKGRRTTLFLQKSKKNCKFPHKSALFCMNE